MTIEWDTVLSVGVAGLIIGVLLLVLRGPLLRFGEWVHKHKHDGSMVEPESGV